MLHPNRIILFVFLVRPLLNNVIGTSSLFEKINIHRYHLLIDTFCFLDTHLSSDLRDVEKENGESAVESSETSVISKTIDSSASDTVKEVPVVIPIPLPIYIPVPIPMYKMPVPSPIPIAIPVPLCIPTPHESLEKILNDIQV